LLGTVAQKTKEMHRRSQGVHWMQRALPRAEKNWGIDRVSCKCTSRRSKKSNLGGYFCCEGDLADLASDWGRRLKRSSTFRGKKCTPRENLGYAYEVMYWIETLDNRSPTGTIR